MKAAIIQTSVTSQRSSTSRGFTLIELVTVLTIMALIVAASVPAIDGVVKEHQAREPLEAFAVMARSVRKRAMENQRPYQIGLDGTGCYAAPYFQPYLQGEEYELLRREAEAKEASADIAKAGEARFGSDPNAAKPDPDANFLERYDWPDDMKVRVRFWGDPEWQQLDSGAFRRWVFQSSGLSRPLVLQLENEGVFLEAEFNPMTAEIQRERSYVD